MKGRGLLPLLLLAIALGGCGGGDEPSQEGSPSASAAEPAVPAGAGAQGQAGQRGEADEQAEGQEPKSEEGFGSPNPPIAKERTPGSKAVAPGVPTTKGADNSIPAFGTEGQTDEAAQAAANLRNYLQARIAKDWERACALASEEYRSQLEQLIERAKVKQEGAQKPEDCAETLELLFGKTPAQALKEAAQVDRILSFRVEEDGYAYLIYEAGGAVKFIAMANDDGAWKVNVPEPTELPETELQGSSQ